MDTTRPKISRTAAGLQPSRRSAIAPFIVMDVMQAAAEREAQGYGVIHMEVGQPGTPAPRAALARVAQALERETLGYTVALGLPALRERIARHYAERHGIAERPAPHRLRDGGTRQRRRRGAGLADLHVDDRAPARLIRPRRLHHVHHDEGIDLAPG